MKRFLSFTVCLVCLLAIIFVAERGGFFEKNALHASICAAESPLEDVEALFPRFRVSARPKGSDGEHWLEVLTPTDGGELLLRFRGAVLSVPQDAVETALPAPQTLSEAGERDIERAAAVFAPTAATRYLVWTDLSRLSTYVLCRQGDGWRLLRRLPCSAGDAAHPSPEGLYSLGVHRLSFGRAGYYSAAFALQISGNYLYHSVLLSPDGERVLDGRLGERISHGCIRHSLEDSRWLYETVPDGTAILIR